MSEINFYFPWLSYCYHSKENLHPDIRDSRPRQGWWLVPGWGRERCVDSHTNILKQQTGWVAHILCSFSYLTLTRTNIWVFSREYFTFSVVFSLLVILVRIIPHHLYSWGSGWSKLLAQWNTTGWSGYLFVNY